MAMLTKAQRKSFLIVGGLVAGVALLAWWSKKVSEPVDELAAQKEGMTRETVPTVKLMEQPVSQ